MSHEQFHVGQFNFLSVDEYEATLMEVVESGWYTNHGPQAQSLELELAALLEVEHCVLVSNATLGLAIAMEAVGTSSRILMPALSFPATLWSAQFMGLPVQLIDVELETGHVDVTALDSLAEEGDLLVVPNIYGGASRVNEITRIAGERKCGLIFDSAGSLGASIDGRKLGGFGNCEVFSLHATKIVGAGEGGFITTNDEKIASRARSMRSSYGNPTPVQVRRTANARISEMQAACARRSLTRLDDFIMHNSAISSLYRDAFSPVPLSPISVSPGVQPNGSSCTYLVAAEADQSSANLVSRLQRRGIRARRYYNPGLHKLPTSGRMEVLQSDLCNTDKLLSQVIQFPVGGLITAANAEYIADVTIQEMAHLA